MTAPDFQDDDPDYGDESEDRTVNLNRQQIRSLERDAKRARKADEELAQLRRENAFIKAGIDPTSDPKLDYFMRGYAGEVNAEAIRSAAETAGFLAPTVNVQDEQDSAAHARVSAASAGTSTSAGTKDDPIAGLVAAAAHGKDALLEQIRKDGHNIL